eukprot:2717523-Prymnesium_polylepis.1
MHCSQRGAPPAERACKKSSSTSVHLYNCNAISIEYVKIAAPVSPSRPSTDIFTGMTLLISIEGNIVTARALTPDTFTPGPTLIDSVSRALAPQGIGKSTLMNELKRRLASDSSVVFVDEPVALWEDYGLVRRCGWCAISPNCPAQRRLAPRPQLAA